MSDDTIETNDASTALRRTALYAEHQALGATFTDFGGWEMPLKYGSELAEHAAVRQSAGLFDLSHMGEIRVTGAQADEFMNTALVGNLGAVRVGRAKYTLLCNAAGGIIDDLIVYRLGEQEFLIVPNAGNTPVVHRELLERAQGFDTTITDESAATSLIAVQGPNAEAIVRALVPESQRQSVTDLGYYAVAEVAVLEGAAAVPVLLARTGYTGEDGFELFVANEDAQRVWRALLEAGHSTGLVPAGLAARDSLRLEAGMPLYGNELTTETTPFEVGLGGVVSFAKLERFVGRDALEATRNEPPKRALVGLRGLGRRAGRAGYAVLAAHADARAEAGEAHETHGAHGASDSGAASQIGVITSGQPSPTLGYPIALALVDPAFSEVGTALDVDLRGKRQPFEVVTLPFYRREA